MESPIREQFLIRTRRRWPWVILDDEVFIALQVHDAELSWVARSLLAHTYSVSPSIHDKTCTSNILICRSSSSTKEGISHWVWEVSSWNVPSRIQDNSHRKTNTIHDERESPLPTVSSRTVSSVSALRWWPTSPAAPDGSDWLHSLRFDGLVVSPELCPWDDPHALCRTKSHCRPWSSNSRAYTSKIVIASRFFSSRFNNFLSSADM